MVSSTLGETKSKRSLDTISVTQVKTFISRVEGRCNAGRLRDTQMKNTEAAHQVQIHHIKWSVIMHVKNNIIFKKNTKYCLQDCSLVRGRAQWNFQSTSTELRGTHSSHSKQLWTSDGWCGVGEKSSAVNALASPHTPSAGGLWAQPGGTQSPPARS